MLAMVREKDIIFISTSDCKEFFTIENAMEEPIKRASFSPDGLDILVVGVRSKHAKVFKCPAL